jgi:ABC-type multidrug transport system permease subunit
MFRGLTSIIYKEVFHLVRDPRSLFLMFLMPAMDMIIFGYAIDLEVSNIATAVYDLDGRQESRELLDMFANSGYFALTERVGSDEEMLTAVVQNRAKVAVKIPPDFTDRVVSGRPAAVQVLLDGSDSTVAMQALQVVNAIALNKSLDILSETIDTRAALPVEVRPRVLFNPDMRTANFMIPGIVVITMLQVTLLLTALTIVREKEQGTLEQLMVTPVSRLGLMTGKLIPSGLIGFTVTALVLVMMVVVFRVPIVGSVGLLALFSLAFLFASLGMGLLTSTLANNQMQAVQFAFVMILPAVLLSGFMFPRESMPLPVYMIGQVIPATYFMQIIRGIILRGAGFWDLWPQAAILLGMGVACIVVAASRFHKTLD